MVVVVVVVDRLVTELPGWGIPKTPLDQGYGRGGPLLGLARVVTLCFFNLTLLCLSVS